MFVEYGMRPSDVLGLTCVQLNAIYDYAAEEHRRRGGGDADVVAAAAGRGGLRRRW